MLQRSNIRTCVGFALLSMLLAILPGCATDTKVNSPVDREPTVDEKPSVSKLEDGREGFIITEVPKIDASARRDFDRAVANLN
ncbi:MAG TPA: hypothetical protein VFG95_03535, partial [Nitrospiria bacterium]|nr:hypothetical protein [Nitrospiria bacterium]